MINLAYDTLIRLGQRVAQDERVLCLLGLGSMSEIERMDEFSDMDFFLIVKEGTKTEFIDNIDWLAVEPIVFSFKNTPDGYKALLGNGAFAEFAVFEPSELQHISFTKGRIIFARPSFDISLIEPLNVPVKEKLDIDYCVNEALTNIYIGLLRERRGEKAAAFMSIQVYAAHNIMRLFEEVFESKTIKDDPYAIDRRIEQKYEYASQVLKGIRQGYDHNGESAQYGLDFLKTYFKPNQALLSQIQKYI